MLHTAKRLAQEVKNKSENLRVLKNKFKLFNNCTDPTEIAVIIDILNNNNLLTKENLELVSKQTNLDDLNSAIRILEENRLLDQKNFDRIIKEANRYKIAKILSFFKKNSISIEEHINFLNEEYFLALNTLHDAIIFTKENLALLKTNEGNSFSSARILTELNNAKILTEENFAKIKNFDIFHIWLVISIIKNLNQANILNDDHFDAVINCENLLEMEKQIGKLVKQEKLNNHSFQNIINEIQSLKRNKTSFDTPTSLKKTTTSPSLKAAHESATIPDLTSETHPSINDLHKIEEDNHSPTLENKNKAETSGLSFCGDTTQDHLIKTPPQQGNTSSSYLAMFTIPLQWLVSPIQVIKSYCLQFFASLYPEGQSTLAIESSEDHKQQTLALAPEDSDKNNNKPSDTTTQPHEAMIPSVSAEQKANTVELTSASTYSHDSPRFFNDQSTRNKQDPDQRETSKHISYR
ncbi:hypothetical protein [Rickettsiella massiliensis]|uniref:hypothetical protein n=1 Tax=Rickettsiella massiliensis TaxID=676517 RepID=UPI00029B160E|nr:hypothetical protein [Rickettsiella massiliensis]